MPLVAWSRMTGARTLMLQFGFFNEVRMKNSVACVLIVVGSLLLLWPAVMLLLSHVAYPTPLRTDSEKWEGALLSLHALVCFVLGLTMVGMAISYFRQRP